MNTTSRQPLSSSVSEYLGQQEAKSLLRFLTCGSVDDGKSTLIGRLLYDTKRIFEDQLAALERDSAKHGTTGDDIDFALLVDGLEAEREQGITIDVSRDRASRRLPTTWKSSCMRAVAIPSCWTATMSATASIAIWASPTPTGSKTSAALPKWQD